MSHVSKKSRLNKPLSIYTPPLLQQRAHQAQAAHQSNRLSTLLQCNPIPGSAFTVQQQVHPPFPPPPFVLRLLSFRRDCFPPLIWKIHTCQIKFRQRNQGICCRAQSRARCCQELFVAQLPNSQTEKVTVQKALRGRNNLLHVNAHQTCFVIIKV